MDTLCAVGGLRRMNQDEPSEGRSGFGRRRQWESQDAFPGSRGALKGRHAVLRPFLR